MTGASAWEPGLQTLDVFLNYACQAKCPFCYNPPLTPELVRWRLPLKRLAKELLDGRRRGCAGVTFSGGEVTLLKDLPKMLRLARRAGYRRIGVISNGLRLSEPAYAGELVRAGLNFCCLSVHGAQASMHDRMVRVRGAFRKVLQALDWLRGAGIGTVLNFVLTRENCAQAEAFVERFGALEGVLELQLYYPHYDGLMAENARALALPMSKAVRHLERALAAARRIGAGGRTWVYNVPPCAAPRLRDRLRNWEREGESLLIDPRGVGEGVFLQERRDRFKNEECRRCALDARCLGYERGYVERFGEKEIAALTAEGRA